MTMAPRFYGVSIHHRGAKTSASAGSRTRRRTGGLRRIFTRRNLVRRWKQHSELHAKIPHRGVQIASGSIPSISGLLYPEERSRLWRPSPRPMAAPSAGDGIQPNKTARAAGESSSLSANSGVNPLVPGESSKKVSSTIRRQALEPRLPGFHPPILPCGPSVMESEVERMTDRFSELSFSSDSPTREVISEFSSRLESSCVSDSTSASTESEDSTAPDSTTDGEDSCESSTESSSDSSQTETSTDSIDSDSVSTESCLSTSVTSSDSDSNDVPFPLEASRDEGTAMALELSSANEFDRGRRNRDGLAEPTRLSEKSSDDEASEDSLRDLRAGNAYPRAARGSKEEATSRSKGEISSDSDSADRDSRNGRVPRFQSRRGSNSQNFHLPSKKSGNRRRERPESPSASKASQHRGLQYVVSRDDPSNQSRRKQAVCPVTGYHHHSSDGYETSDEDSSCAQNVNSSRCTTGLSRGREGVASDPCFPTRSTTQSSTYLRQTSPDQLHRTPRTLSPYPRQQVLLGGRALQCTSSHQRGDPPLPGASVETRPSRRPNHESPAPREQEPTPTATSAVNIDNESGRPPQQEAGPDTGMLVVSGMGLEGGATGRHHHLLQQLLQSEQNCLDIHSQHPLPQPLPLYASTVHLHPEGGFFYELHPAPFPIPIQEATDTEDANIPHPQDGTGHQSD